MQPGILQDMIGVARKFRAHPFTVHPSLPVHVRDRQLRQCQGVPLGRVKKRRTVRSRRMLEFAMRPGSQVRLRVRNRTQTKGKGESGVKYARRDMRPSARHRRC